MGVVPLEGFRATQLVRPAGDSLTRIERYRRGWRTFLETLKLSLDALRAHKLRSFLTLLGVILAVLTLVVVMSVIAGLNLYVATRVANLGANVFIVDRFGIITSQDAFIKAQKRPMIDMEDYARLRDGMKVARAVAAEEDHNVQTKVGNAIMENTQMMGTTANFADIRNLEVAQGRFITQSDDEHRQDVVFIGPDLVAKFFPNGDPIGKTIKVQTHSYEVIGVAAPLGSALANRKTIT